ncbi:hypothetical protein MKX01_029560 [Papaver californicum]|nr:hypothetical protein MKX01_029560 [Papaver californicum]
MEPDTLKQRIQDIILRLYNIIEVNDKIDRGYDAKGEYALTSMAKNKLANQEKEFPNSYYLKRDIKEDICQLVLSSHLQNTILERKENALVNVTTLLGELLQYVEELIEKDFYNVLLQETVKEWNEGLESYNIERHIEEELYNIVFRESIKDMHDFTSVLIREEVCTVILQEIFKEYKDALKEYNTESWIGEDVIQIVFSTACWKSGSQDNVMEDIYVNRLSSLEGKIKEDAVLLKNMDMILKDLERYKYESLVEDEIYQIVMNEVVKDLKDVIKFTLNERQEAKDQVKVSNSNILFQSLEGLMKEYVCKVVLKEMVKNWNKELRIHNLERLREMKHHFEPDVELVSSLKKRELLCRKAFLRRCYDFQKAETEIMEIINAIRKELYGPAACTSLL